MLTSETMPACACHNAMLCPWEANSGGSPWSAWFTELAALDAELAQWRAASLDALYRTFNDLEDGATTEGP